MANLHPFPVRRWAAVVLGLSTLALGLAVAAAPSGNGFITSKKCGTTRWAR